MIGREAPAVAIYGSVPLPRAVRLVEAFQAEYPAGKHGFRCRVVYGDEVTVYRTEKGTIVVRGSPELSTTDAGRDKARNVAESLKPASTDSVVAQRHGLHARLLLVLPLVMLLAACGSFGPSTVATDRLAYARVTADSAKQQALLNIVRLRYGDYVSFFHVGQVVSGYTLAGEGQVGANVFTRNWSLGDDLSLGALLRFEDRPTITYNPVTGPELARSMLNPFPPGELFLMLAAGYPADLVLGIMARSVEGLPNALQEGVPAEGAGRFSEFVGLTTRAQAAGLIGAKRDGGEQGPVVLVLRDGEDAAARAAIDRLRALLGLTAEVPEARIVYGTGPGPADEIVVQTRPIIEVLVALGARILVPDDHVAAGRTPATAFDPAGVAPVAQVRIRSSLVPPEDTFASVRYADHWFWIDEDDYPSKRTLSFLLFLSAVVESAGERQAPLLTIPTG